MSTKLHPWQVTGGLDKGHHDMLFTAKNVEKERNCVFGEGYFSPNAPAKTFRTRNRSMIAQKTERMIPMEVKKKLHLYNGFNYAQRKFHL